MEQEHKGQGDNIAGNKITYINNNTHNAQDSKLLNLSPIKGLFAFDSFDAELFKSLERQSDIKGLRNALLAADYKIGLLVGESGCGKTSLLRAGLAPELKSSTHICVVATITNEDPIKSIYTALRTQLSLSELIFNDDLKTLMEETLRLIDQTTIILVLDQFEQFYTQRPHPNDQQEFLKQLEVITEMSGIRLLLSMRTDFAHYGIDLLGTVRTNFNFFQIRKFTISQVIRIFKFIADKAQSKKFDEKFVKRFISDDLVDKGGLVSATDIQIVAFMLETKQDKLDFSESAFQKIGGVIGLLKQYVEEQLETKNKFNKDNSVLYTLLALVDGEVRVGQLTSVEIAAKLTNTIDLKMLEQILDWLCMQRLVAMIQQDGQPVRYELAHERLIEPLNQIEDKAKAGPRKASALLNRRVNEWLGYNRSSKYLFSWKDYRQIKKFEHLLNWGGQEVQKRELLQKSRGRIRYRSYAAMTFLFLCAGVLLARQTTYYQLEYQAPKELERIVTKYLQPKDQKRTLDSLIRTDFNRAKNMLHLSTLNGAYLYSVKAGMVKAMAEEKEFTQALAVANTIVDEDSKAMALQSVAAAMAKAKVPGYQAIFAQALAVANTIVDKDSKADALQSVASAMAEAKEFAQALAVANTIVDEDSKAMALQSVASAMAEAKVPGYQAIFAQALTVANAIVDEDLKADALRNVAAAMAEVKEFAQALAVAKAIPDKLFKTLALQSVAAAMVEAKEFAQALTVTKAMVDEDSKARALQSVAAAMAEVKEFNQALTVANTIVDEDSKARALQSVAAAMAEVKEFNQALTVAKAIPNKFSKTLALQSVAAAMAKAKVSGYQAIFTQALAVANTIVDEDSKAMALQSVAAAMAKAKVPGYQAIFAQALAVANTIVDKDSKADALQSVASAMAEAKEFAQALAVANTIVGEYSKAMALQDIIENLVKANHYKEAYELVLNIPDINLSKGFLLVYLSDEWHKWLKKQNYLTILSTNIIPSACG